MRVVAITAALLMAISAGMMVLPTREGVETALAFQRTDIAAVILALTLAGLAGAIWQGMIGIALGVIGICVAFVGQSLFAGNPQLGSLAKLYIFVGPILALGFGLVMQMASTKVRQRHSPDLRPAVPSFPATEVVAAQSDVQTQPPLDAPGTDGANTGASIETSAEPTTPNSDLVAERDYTTGPAQRAADPFVDEDEKNRLEFLKIRASETEDAATAATLWHQIADEYPDYHPAMNAEALLLFQLGRTSEARSRLDASLVATPDDLATLSLAARYAATDKDFAAAERHWADAFKSHDLNDSQAGAYINALVQQQKYEEASALYHRFANDWPDRPKLIRIGASAAEGRGSYAEAHELWQAAIALEPGIFSDTRRSIVALIALDDLVGAARETRSYLQEAPDEPEPKALADRIMRLASSSERADAMEPVAILGAQNPSYWAAWIEARLAAGDLVKAETAFQQAAEHGTEDPALLRAGALIAQKAQRRDLEAERWSALVELTPDDMEAVRRAAVAVSALGDLEAAKKLVDDGLELQPTHMALLSLKGNIAGRMQEWNESIAAWKVYGMHYEVTPFVIEQTSRALRGLKRFDEAAQIIQAGLADTPDSKDLLIENARIADGHLALADSAAEPDAKTERLNAWKAAVEVAATDSMAWQKLILALLDDGNKVAAQDALAEARTALSDTTQLLANARIAALAESAS